MTFEEWFEQEYGCKPDLENENAFIDQVAKAAWDAGYSKGYDVGYDDGETIEWERSRGHR